jgi:hypothetical protein
MRTTSADRISCVRCTAPYLPSLTRHRCPVCDTPAPGDAPLIRAWDDPDDRLMAIVALATLANVLLLAILSLAVLS